MTEEEWLACSNPQLMLVFLGGKVSERKLRLFAVACCRSFRTMLSEREQTWVELGEGWADRTVGSEKLREAVISYDPTRDLTSAARAAFSVMRASSWNAAIDASRNSACALSADIYEDQAGIRIPSARRRAVLTEQAALLRHVVGNPFRPQEAVHWPSTVVQLAHALYDGPHCGFALHDALLDAGHAELAQHFREQTNHPKGCWVVDHLRGCTP